MIFEIEFLCADLRPLLKEDDKLVDYLKPLHLYNHRIFGPVFQEKKFWDRFILTRYKNRKSKKQDDGQRNPILEKNIKDAKGYMPFYRNIGIINTKSISKRTFFKAKNSIRFTNFETHQLVELSNKYNLLRGNHVRRHFSTDAYGVVNRLKLGFEFYLETLEEKEEFVIDEQKNMFELMKYVFQMPIKIKGTSETIPTSELGNSLCKIVSDSTKYRNNDKNKQTQTHPNVIPVGATAIILYKEGELPDLPNTFKNKGKYQDLKIFFYDYFIDSGLKHIRVYAIQYNENSSLDILHKLKSHLLDLRMSCLYVDQLIFKIGDTNSKQTAFYKEQLKKIHFIRNNEQFGFIDLKDQDQGEVCEISQRRKIDDEIAIYNFTQLSIS